MPTRKEQSALTRQKIIDVVEDKIRKEGYDNIRIVDIAKECHMSTGNFYHYFSSLEALFDEIDSVKFYESFEALHPQNDIHVVSRLESYLKTWMDLSLNKYGSKYIYYWTQRYTKKFSASDTDNRVSLIVKHLTEILNQGLEKGELLRTAPVQDIAYTIAFLIFGCAAYYGASNDEELVRHWSKNCYSFFIKPAIAPYLVF